MSYSKKELCYIWLSVAGGISPTKREKLFALVEDVCDLYDALESLEEDVVASVGKETYLRLLSAKEEDAALREVEALDRLGAVALTEESEHWLPILSELAQPPLVLYAKGDVRLLSTPCIAVVGTRAPTRYGRDVTESFVADLATNGFTIVSGLARGVDTIAHRVALQYEKPTVGVMPCGLDRIYPAENKELYEEIGRHGLLLTEYPLGTGVQQFTFVERNRLIAALAKGVLVTEAGEKSGSSITVNHALEQGKDVFAVPGNIYSKTSMGTNKLLKDMQGALVTSAMDILESYHVAVDPGPVCELQLDIIESQIMEALEDGDKHIEELLALTGMTVSQIGAILTKLELMGLIHKLNGNYYGV